MKNWEKVLVAADATLAFALEVIDAGGRQMCLIADGDRRLLGTVSDGDVRRGLLRGVALSDAVEKVMNNEPRCASTDDAAADVLAQMRRLGVHQIPIIDPDRRIVGLATIDDFMSTVRHDQWVVIMAGGEGSRLKELTRDVPKPMLTVGTRPILETIIRRFIDQGFHNFFLAVNYKADLIEAHFGDGSALGVTIRYLRESQPLGTAGALSLLPERPTAEIIVSNGDLLTNENLSNVLTGHLASGATATMLVREYEVQVPFGVVEEDGDRILSITEKPVHRHMISAGMYVLTPEVLDQVPADEFFDMPALFERIIAQGKRARCHRIEGYWLDIGWMPDFERANSEFAEFFE